MDSSRRAVESYWRSRMIDAATSDEDKVTPVYKLEEICDLLRSSHVSIVKELSEFIVKRLEHKSPIVKQKALRLIKYAVGKSGAEFRREMQRNSVAVKQLFHYKGQLDPLKADSLNKAVRDTAHEAVTAIFAAEENKAAPPSENLTKRIQGFGNTNFEMQTEDKKSFLSEVVGLGSASIKQGLSSFTQAHSHMKNDSGSGSYKSPNLRRSLTTEIDYRDKYDPALGVVKNGSSGPWGQESGMESTNGNSSSSRAESNTREEKLLNTIVTSGGVRLQPTRDALQIFLVEALKLDTVSLSIALESKLQSPSWQVRMKAACVLEAILRRKDDDERFLIVATFFSENKDVIVRSSESPQASLKEKANKILSLLGGGQTSSTQTPQEKPLKSTTTPFVEMPDLIDTGDSISHYGTEDSTKNHDNETIESSTKPTPPPLIDDIFGDSMASGANTTSEQNSVDDPFADVSFHTSEDKDNLFQGINGIQSGATKNGPELFDIFGSSSTGTKDVNNLMADLSVNENTSKVQESGIFPGVLANDGSQTIGTNQNASFPTGSTLYNTPPGIMFNQAFPVNYAAMGNILAQQQFLATMANFQQFGNMNLQNYNVGPTAGTKEGGGFSSPLPDVFQPNFPTQTPTSMMGNSKREDTKAFDFISDHLAAARDPKRGT